MVQDYSSIRGFCYPAGAMKEEAQIRKELEYAVKLQLNSARIWLLYERYFEDPKGFLEGLRQFIRIANELGITTMPILWNGNGIDPDILKPDEWEQGDRYVTAVVDAVKDEPGIILWDIMNEPTCNDYILKADPVNLPHRKEMMWAFVRHYCELVKSLDGETPITVGHTYVEDVAPTVDVVDVMSFHDYLSTEKMIRATYERAIELQKQYGKPFINSELACLCRANPYDLSLRLCEEYDTGWYLFELMIDGYWSDVHGIFYPNGTIRDPSIVAAVMGFHRNRRDSAVRVNPNKEGYAERGIQMVKEALEEKTEVFRAGRRPIADVLEAAEFCANLLECCELVPMYDPPTAKIQYLRRHPDMVAARKLAYSLAQQLRDCCQLL